MPYKIESKSMTVKSVVEGIADVLVSPGAGVGAGELVSAGGGGGAVHAGELMSPAKERGWLLIESWGNQP